MTAVEKLDWQKVCNKSDLVAGSGVCALIGKEQIAVFFLPDEEQPLYAIHNYDPIGGANVLSRGILGDLAGQLVVASPLYKQHFSLTSGACIEDDEARVTVYDIKSNGDTVFIRV